MPRKRVNKSPPVEKRRDDGDDDDFFFDDSQSNSGRSSQEPQHRNAANARERARMRVLSKAFCRLKTTLPWVPADTKLSKLDTLRLAASYIAHLRALLHEPRSAHTPPHPLSLAWPFAFQHGGGGAIGCSISQRWNIGQASDSGRLQPSKGDVQTHDFRRDYNDTDFEDRGFEEAGTDAPCMQYYEYGNKDNCYEMRGYPSENIVNNNT